MEQLVIEITGIVQGVHLRGRISKMANSLYLKGYVKNHKDGSIEILAQGKRASLEELLSYCQKPPFLVRVTGMSYEWSQPEKEYKKFKVEKEQPVWKDQARSFVNLGKEVLSNEKLNVPKHVVIIPDGNRRWAREKGWRAYIGHRRAAKMERVLELFNKSKELGVEYLTLWAFSTENWKREDREVEEIFNLVRTLGKDLRQLLIDEEIRFRSMGRRDRLPEDVLAILDDLTELTKDHDKLNFQLCLDYNGRDDLVRAVRGIIDAGVEEINEEVISEYLDSNGIPDPDLVIRTSGERRTSGIMAYQAAYAELYFTNVYFPDFDAEHFKLAVYDYAARNRRFGGTLASDLKTDPEKLIDPDANLAV